MPAGIQGMSVNQPYVETELLQQVASGDRMAFRRLFDQLWASVYSAALRLTRSPEMAQDLSQEVFVRLWENRSKLADVTNIYAWLYTITRNLVTDFLRKKVFQDNNKAFLASYYAHNDADPFSTLELREQQEKLKAAIEQLPLQLKQVVTLSYFEGRSHKEIAAILQITPASSRIYLVRAIAMLRKNSAGDGNKVLLKLLWLAMVP